MKVEILTIGDELLTGHTVDTNSAFIAAELTGSGFEIYYKSTTGDSQEMMEDAFRLALSRADIIITTGGLGPTDDDITKKAIVKVFKRNLIFHEEVLEDIKKRYALRGIEMPAINQNQALLPQGAKFFPNPIGSALGLCINENNKIFISLPGVPREMKHILTEEVLPYLNSLRKAQSKKIIKLRTTGIVESKLAEMIMPNLKLEQGVKLAYLPSYSGVDLRIIASAENQNEADEHAYALKRFLQSTVGKYIYGQDDDSLDSVVAQLLLDNDRTISVAESCTGGSLGEAITSVPGSSKYFIGGIISYSNLSKVRQLGVSEEILDRYGAVSEDCAKAMADGCRDKFETDYALSITGIAGPDGGTEQKPVGTTYIGLSSIHGSYAKRFNFGSDRNSNRIRATYAALELLRRDILDIK